MALKHLLCEIQAISPACSPGQLFQLQNVGKQPGSSSESAKVIVGVVRGDRVASKANAKEGGDWPDLDMLVLGSDALTNIREKCQRILKSLDEWEGVARSIDIKGE